MLAVAANSVNSVMYQPTATEIATVAASAKKRWPTLTARIDKAVELLRDGSLQLEPVAWEVRQDVRWRVASQTGKGAYVVVRLLCPCQDKRTAYCKHAIAVALLMKVLRNKVNADIRAREIDLGILPDGSFNAYAKSMGIVHMRKSGTAYTFVDDASAVRYGIYLAKRQLVALAA